jgi:hypothetical protein
MSELALIKDLDGHPAVFCRFEGADKFVLHANGQFRTVSRDTWRSLPIYPHGTPVPSDSRREAARPPRR